MYCHGYPLVADFFRIANQMTLSNKIYPFFTFSKQNVTRCLVSVSHVLALPHPASLCLTLTHPDSPCLTLHHSATCESVVYLTNAGWVGVYHMISFVSILFSFCFIFILVWISPITPCIICQQNNANETHYHLQFSLDTHRTSMVHTASPWHAPTHTVTHHYTTHQHASHYHTSTHMSTGWTRMAQTGQSWDRRVFLWQDGIPWGVGGFDISSWLIPTHPIPPDRKKTLWPSPVPC